MFQKYVLQAVPTHPLHKLIIWYNEVRLTRLSSSWGMKCRCSCHHSGNRRLQHIKTTFITRNVCWEVHWHTAVQDDTYIKAADHMDSRYA